MNQTIIKIDNWSITSWQGPFTAPEIRKISLHGTVQDHDRFPPGSDITTSSIIKAEGLKIYTRSGSMFNFIMENSLS